MGVAARAALNKVAPWAFAPPVFFMVQVYIYLHNMPFRVYSCLHLSSSSGSCLPLVSWPCTHKASVFPCLAFPSSIGPTIRLFRRIEESQTDNPSFESHCASPLSDDCRQNWIDRAFGRVGERHFDQAENLCGIGGFSWGWWGGLAQVDRKRRLCGCDDVGYVADGGI